MVRRNENELQALEKLEHRNEMDSTECSERI
jgi:hypothetical protein